MGNTGSLSIDTARFNLLGPLMHIRVLPTFLVLVMELQGEI